jgi:hypothetical protein
MSAPDGAEEMLRQAVSPLPLAGQEDGTTLSTGCASGGFAVTPLHPWLQSDVSAGAFATHDSIRFPHQE